MKRKTIILAVVISLTAVYFFLKLSKRENQEPSSLIPHAFEEIKKKVTDENLTADSSKQKVSEKSPETPQKISDTADTTLSKNPQWKLPEDLQERYGKGKLIRTEERSDPKSHNRFRSFLIETEKKYRLLEIEQQISSEDGSILGNRIYVADHVIAKLKKPLESAEVQETLRDLGLTPRGAMNAPFVLLHFDRNNPRNSPQKIMDDLQQTGLVEYVERDSIVVAK